MSNANVPDSTAKRTTTTASTLSASRPPLRIHPSAVIGDKASLTGIHMITIGPNAVIHPYAKLSSQHGSISIGGGCIIAERSWIGLLDASRERRLLHAQRGGQGSEETEADVALCDNVTVNSGAVVQASSVGKWSVVEINAKIEPGCVLGEHCKVNACITLPSDTQLPGYTVVYGPNNDSRINETLKSNDQVQYLKAKGHKQHIEVLRSVFAELDHTSFTKRVRVGPSSVHGKGLSAMEAIPVGGIVLCENAFAIGNEAGHPSTDNDFVIPMRKHEPILGGRQYWFNPNTGRAIVTAQYMLLPQDVKILLSDPSLAAQLYDLYAGPVKLD